MWFRVAYKMNNNDWTFTKNYSTNDISVESFRPKYISWFIEWI